MVPGPISSGSHSVTMLNWPTMVTSVGLAPLLLLFLFRCRSCELPSRASALEFARGLLVFRGPASENISPYFSNRIAQADPEQRLAGVLENVNDLSLGVFQKDALPVGQQMVLRTIGDSFGKPSSKFLLQELHDAANALQRKCLAPKGTDHGDFGQVFRRVHPPP